MNRPPLEQAALDAKRFAYAPYSKFHVGAAVRVDGEVFTGVNVENASFPLSVCAERNAIAAAILAGKHHLEEVAVATDASPPSAPCGGCRQVLREFAADPDHVRITAINSQGERRAWTLGQLLPDSFTGAELP
ncbi:MAG TPA: cytidine deaminase [Kofleriaceae bacterium]|nr:cytidine deaminase [Kofleriaceae bacterium]